MGDSVYQPTTTNYESLYRQTWHISEAASSSITRSRWFQLTILVSLSLIIGLGLIVVVIGIYNQYHYSESEDTNTENRSSNWIIPAFGIVLSVMGVIILLLCYYKLGNPRSLCSCPQTSRSVIRYANKPRLHNGQTNQGANLLAKDNVEFQPVSTKYEPIIQIGDDHINTLN